MSFFPTTILLATDGSPDSRLAMVAAADLAGRTGSKLHLIHVERPKRLATHPFGVDAGFEGAEESSWELLLGEAREVERCGAPVADIHFVEGRPSQEIVKLALELSAGLVAIGSRGLGRLQRLVLGSVSEGVVQRAPCPVLVMRGGEAAWPPRWVVVGEDFSPEAERAAEIACELAKLYSVSATLLWTYPPPPGDEAGMPPAREELLRLALQHLNDRAFDLQGVAGRRPEIRLEAGDAAEVLVRASEELSGRALIAVGRRGLDAAQPPDLGSTSIKVLHAAPGPVLICPSKEAPQP